MTEPLSPDHVFDFLADDPTLDLEDPVIEVEEDPEEEPEEDVAEAIPPVVGSPPESPAITPPHCRSLHRISILLLLLLLMGHSGCHLLDATKTSDDVLALHEGRDRDQEKMRKLERRVDALEGAVEARPSESIDVLTNHASQMIETNGCERLVKNQVDEAIAEYKRNRTYLEGAGGSGGNAGEDTTPVRWYEKMELVFEIRISAANKIPWNKLKTKMTAEYCPRTEIQKMEQELWTLSMKGDDIDGYTNRFYELAVMYPTLATPAYKKAYNVHEAICMARDLVNQSVRAKATRVNERNKRKWEDPQRNNNNNHSNTHHQQQNRRQEAARAYVVALVEGIGSVRESVIKKRTVELGLQQQVSTSNRMWYVMGVEKRGTIETSSLRERTRRIKVLAEENM
ncbi:reverse transcriptase domain-containing protein, partial [Tanacetum coccineum]